MMRPFSIDVIAIRDRRSEAKILLDQEDGEALLLEHADGLADLLDDDGRQTLGGLVEQQEPGARAQDAADGQHLLLAARKLRSLAGQALLEVGKQLEDAPSKIEAAGRTRGGSSRFSSTLRLAKMPRSSGHSAMPSRAIRSLVRRMSSLPS